MYVFNFSIYEFEIVQIKYRAISSQFLDFIECTSIFNNKIDPKVAAIFNLKLFKITKSIEIF